MHRQLAPIRWLTALIVCCTVMAWSVLPPGMCLMEITGDECACCDVSPDGCGGKCCSEKSKPANHNGTSDCGGASSVCFSTPHGTSLMPRDTEHLASYSALVMPVVAMLPLAGDIVPAEQLAGPAPPRLRPPPPAVLRI